MKRILLVLALIIFAGCGSSGTTQDPDLLRPATDAPESFIPVFATTSDNNECQSRLVDPVEQVELVLIRALGEVGDYVVPAGRYGVAADELLRIECRSGKVIGVVSK